MFRYKYIYCKKRMVSYINGELSDATRRRVARFISECDECYAEYIRQRNLQREIQSSIPILGRASDEQLSRIWTGIEMDLTNSRPLVHRNSLRYGFVVAIALSMLVVPLLFSEGERVQPTVTQPTPATRTIRSAPTEQPAQVLIAYQVTRVGLTVSVQDAMMPEAAPGRTPDPTR